MKLQGINKVSISHGKYLYPTTSGSMYVSAIPLRGDISAGFLMPKDQYTEHRGASSYVPASPTGKKETGGFTCNKVLDIPNSHILKVVNNRKRNGRDYMNAALLILVHEKAGLISVHASLPEEAIKVLGATSSTNSGLTIFEGRGIILSNTNIADLGYSLCPRFMQKYRQKEELEEAFTIQTYKDKGLSLDKFNATITSTGLVVLSTLKAQRRRKVRFD